MKVVLPEKNPFNKKDIIIYASVAVVCVISIIIAFYVQFYARIDFGKMFGSDSYVASGIRT